MLIVKYWMKVAVEWETPALVKDVYIMAETAPLCGRCTSNRSWMTQDSHIYVWTNPTSVDPVYFTAELEETYRPFPAELGRGTAGHNWKTENVKTHQRIFKARKAPCEIPPHLRVPVTRLRTISYQLRIETGKCNLPMGLPVEESTCCFFAVEDQTHFQLYKHMQEFKDLIDYCISLKPSLACIYLMRSKVTPVGRHHINGQSENALNHVNRLETDLPMKCILNQ